MNPHQPSVNQATVNQRIVDRRAAASQYRLTRSGDDHRRQRRFGVWRDAVGRRLVAIGKQLIALGLRLSPELSSGIPSV
jgi:hypothetical protein